jgi:hypothetical protein
MFRKNVQTLHTALVADIPVLLWGPPGTGKTASVSHIAAKLGWHLEVLVGATRDRTDFGGFPRYTPEGTVLDPFPWLRRLIEAKERGRESILFLDELTSTPEDVRPALLRVINERVAGDTPIPARIVAAANPEEHAVGGLLLEAPIANRVLHLSWEMRPQEFVQALREGFETLYPPIPPTPGPETLEHAQAEARELLALFLERNPGAAYQMPKDDQASRAWPSYRSWYLAAKYLGTARALNMDEEVQAFGVVGLVGQTGYAFLAFIRDLDLPHPADVLKNPTLVPSRDDRAYATLQAVITWTATNWSRENWLAAQRVLSYVGETKPDIAAPAASRLIRTYAEAREKRKPVWDFDTAFVNTFRPVLERIKEVVR